MSSATCSRGLEAARDGARAAAREIMSEEIRQGELPDLQQPL
jgi:hypothetical protein